MKELILSFFGSMLPALLFNVNKKHFFWVGLSGVIAWFSYSRVLEMYGQIIVATFTGALAVGLFSEFMARVKKLPATVFSISGIFPIVPGYGAYQTVQLMSAGQLSEAAKSGLVTVSSAGSIALGIMLISAFFRVYGNKKTSSSR